MRAGVSRARRRGWKRRRGRAWAALMGAVWAAAGPGAAGGFGSLQEFSEGLADVVEQVLPSVVVIVTEASWVPLDEPDLIPPRPDGGEKLAGLGSGVVLDREGHVITSRHVIEHADAIRVVFAEGAAFPADLVGADPATDLGVLRIRDPAGAAPHLRPIPMGDSDALRVGEIVLAIGAPFSLRSSVSWGMVSQKGRAVGLLPYDDLIQTDAAINPGNSGGPLVDVNGRMVGLNAVMQTAGPRGSIGIGFAVPGNRVQRVARALIEGRPVRRPWLGMVPAAMNPAAAAELLGARGGVFVREVQADTPAARGGLQPGDVIREVNGEPVQSIVELQREIYKREIGETITMSILRAGRRMELEMVTGATPDAGGAE